jgi:clan AA aspartic protease
MKGYVDDAGRALLTIRIANARDTPHTEVLVWIDTAFDGHLVLPVALIKDLELESLAQTEGILADGSIVTLETHFCFIEWFGKNVPLQVIANDGRFPLLGTEMLLDRVLHIDYRQKQLSLE